MIHRTCQSNNVTYCLECSWCNIIYIGQTKNRIMDRFQGHMFNVKQQPNTTVARHFASHQDKIDLKLNVHTLEYITTLKDAPMSN